MVQPQIAGGQDQIAALAAHAGLGGLDDHADARRAGAQQDPAIDDQGRGQA